MREIISKQKRESINFLRDLHSWREALEKRDWAPWEKSNGESENYKKYCNTLQEFTSLQSRLSLTPRQVLNPEKKITEIATKLRRLSKDLGDQACRLVERDKAYLFSPLVQVAILFHIRDQAFLENLSAGVRHKSKAAQHRNKKSYLVFLTAVLMSEETTLRPRQIYKFLNTPRIRELLRELRIEKREQDQDSFKKWFNRNRAEILSFRDRLTGNLA
jgi:hypothetical protein